MTEITDILHDYNYVRYKNGFSRKRQKQLLSGKANKPKRKFNFGEWVDTYIPLFACILLFSGIGALVLCLN